MFQQWQKPQQKLDRGLRYRRKHCDTETHFVNKVTTYLTFGVNVKLHFSYYPQSGGMRERTNGTII